MQFSVVQVVSGILFAQFGIAVAGNPAHRGIVVIANRTDQPIVIRQAEGDQQAAAHVVAPGDVRPLAVRGSVAVQMGLRGDRDWFLLDPNGAYEFGLTEGGKHELRQIEFDPSATPEELVKRVVRPPKLIGQLTTMPIVTIPVMVLVDEEEPMVQRKWEPRLRKRLQAASLILQEHCRVRFEVVEAGVWQSDNRTSAFTELLRELEKEVPAPPSRLVIGFTSQRRIGVDKGKMGGTRVPLHSYILIREWSKGMSDRERIEVLVHELGHFLGATHSPEINSVMRAQLVDGRSNLGTFRIRFDPLNALILNLVAEEMRHVSLTRLTDLSTENRKRLLDIYARMARELPDDPGVAQSLRNMSQVVAVTSMLPLTRGVRDVLLSMIPDEGASGVIDEDQGDELTNTCVRRAAITASGLSDDVSRHAFLLSLGLALDHTGTLLRHPHLRAAWTGIESDPRLGKSALGFATRLTMQSRHDLAQHFWVSAAMVALVGEPLALAAGVTKELRDANGGSGFSFTDLAADIAGVEFASRVLRSRITLKSLSQDFTTEHFLIESTGLPEGLSSSEFLKKYGTVSGPVFRRQKSQLRKRILALPGYDSTD